MLFAICMHADQPAVLLSQRVPRAPPPPGTVGATATAPKQRIQDPTSIQVLCYSLCAQPHPAMGEMLARLLLLLLLRWCHSPAQHFPTMIIDPLHRHRGACSHCATATGDCACPVAAAATPALSCRPTDATAAGVPDWAPKAVTQ